jgi:predicted flap endonuclease-1-like 5' DNA nuclease
LSQAASGPAANRPTGISAERSESATAGHRATTDMLKIPANQIPASEIPMTAVHGVGPKIAAALVAAGINDLVALARATEEQLAAALENANIRRAANMASWSAQARAFVEAKA